MLVSKSDGMGCVAQMCATSISRCCSPTEQPCCINDGTRPACKLELFCKICGSSWNEPSCKAGYSTDCWKPISARHSYLEQLPVDPACLRIMTQHDAADFDKILHMPKGIRGLQAETDKLRMRNS